jgi:hypothetical protein
MWARQNMSAVAVNGRILASTQAEQYFFIVNTWIKTRFLIKKSQVPFIFGVILQMRPLNAESSWFLV